MMKKFTKRLALTASALILSNIIAVPSAQILAAEEGAVTFEPKVKHEGKAVEGGTLHYALVGDPFEGMLNRMLYTGNPDVQIIDLFTHSLYGYDENFGIDDSGFAKVEFNKDEKSVTIKIPEGVKWDDGEPLTIDDVIFPYYVIGDPEYTGVRYGTDFQNVEGMEEYHDGKAEEISGLERIDDYTLKVHYKVFNNSIMQAGGGVSNYIEPKHILEDIPVKELENSEYVRKNPVGFGPFKVKSITPGESVVLEANEYYYKGRPKIDQIQVDVVSPTSIVAELKSGKYDLAELPSDQYDTFKEAKNFTTIGALENVYTYIGFKLGKWDEEKSEVVPDESLVQSNKALRQAMAYAIDNDAVAKEFYKGIRIGANSTITPNFTEQYYNKDQEAYKYDPEKAKQILTDAGFKDTNGDGFVEDPKGKEFKLGFASMSGGETAEPLAQYYIQMWHEIGVNVELVDGRLMEMNSFYDRVEKDDPAIQVYQAAIGLGGDPNPAGVLGRGGGFNYTRWTTDENEKLIAAIESDKSFDEKFRQKAYYDWQAYIHEEVPVIPTLFRHTLFAVNQRVSQYDVTVGTDLNWTEIELLADKPIAE